MSVISDLSKLLEDSGLVPKIGLKQQGHLSTVTLMVAMGATWEEIGQAIGWQGQAVRQWFEHGWDMPWNYQKEN